MSLPFISLASPEPVQARVAAPFEVNIPGLFGRHATTYRVPSIREALGVPAVNRAVTLISNTGGALSLNGYQDGVLVEPAKRPRIIVRPNPLTTPRVFWRDSLHFMASRGESWWWIARRDKDGMASSLYPVPPYEVKVEENPDDLRYPKIYWRDQLMPSGDMVQVTLMPDPDRPYRGVGPLQLCGAAISVAVEADEWAANFYAEGGYSSVVLRPDVDFVDEDDAEKFKAKWTSNPPNTPQVVSPGMDVTPLPVNEQGSQMLSSRVHNRGEVALMFGIPGSLMEYTQSGSSLTYQNVGDEFDKFVKSCLWPNYLEGLEQALSDLLPRSWIAEFDADRFTRPDPKTRMEIHGLAIAAGVYDAEYAQKLEGLQPGSIETAPLPPSLPASIPPPIQARGEPVRCDGMRTIRTSGVAQLKLCDKLLAESGPFVGRCPRCKKEHAA